MKNTRDSLIEYKMYYDNNRKHYELITYIAKK